MSVDLQRFVIFVIILGALPVIAFLIPAFRPYLRKAPMVTGVSNWVSEGLSRPKK